jgi:ABC-type branched-subunit amino acid transport system substrate-binding protein
MPILCSAQDGANIFDVIALGRPANFKKETDALEIRYAIECVFKKVNDAGGIRGRNVKILEFDDAGDLKKTKNGIQVLMKKYNVIGLISPSSKELSNIMDEMDARKDIASVAAATDNSSLNIISSYPNQEIKVSALIEYAKQARYEKLAILGDEELKNKVVNKATGNFKLVGVSEADAIISFLSIEDTLKASDSLNNRAVILSMRAVTDVKNIAAVNKWIFTDSIVSLDSQKDVVKEYKKRLAEIFQSERPTMNGLRAFMWALVVSDALHKMDGEMTAKGLISQIYKTKALDIGGIMITIDKESGWKWQNLMMADGATGKWVE